MKVFFRKNTLISYCCVDPEVENNHLSLLSENKENSSTHNSSCGCLRDYPVTIPRNIILNRNSVHLTGKMRNDGEIAILKKKKQ